MLFNNTKIHLENRLDVFVKILYIRAYIEDVDFTYYQELYKKHIILFNGGAEDHKVTYQDFENDFQNLIENIKDNGFDSNYPVLVNDNGELINGAHRLACCMYFGIQPSIERVSGKGIIWGNDFFSSSQFSFDEKLEIFGSYTDYSNEYMVFIIWPFLYNSNNEVKQGLKSMGSIVGSVELSTKEINIGELVKDIYSFDEHDIAGGFSIELKQVQLEKFTLKKVELVLLTRTYTGSEKEEKNLIRNNFLSKVEGNISSEEKKFYTFHGGDSIQENTHIKNIFFDKNNWFSYRFRVSLKRNDLFLTYLEQFITYYKSHQLDKGDFCIAGSSVMHFYGLRHSNDLDILAISNQKGVVIEKINENIDLIYGDYSGLIKNEALIYKKYNHLYIRGFKYISISNYLNIKKKLFRKKDSKDIILLEKFIDNYKKGVQKNRLMRSLKSRISLFTRVLQTHIILFGIKFTKKIGIYNVVSYFRRKYILKIH